ncbi:hypothetical protein V2J09_005051 [Rumex salicifolius]
MSSESKTANPLEMEKENGTKEPLKTESVPFYKLFAFANTTDKILMIVGSISAAGNGVCMPLMTVLFGELIDAFGQNQGDNSHVIHVVSMVSCWMVTGERQAARIRNLYLKAIIRQDVAFFDTETNTGEVIGRMSGDTVLIQNAMGEKVGQFIQLTSTFLGGFVIGFVKGWLLTLVMLSCIPLVVIAGAVMSITISKTSSKGQAAYAKASIVVEQSIGSIRTVVSFTGEKQAASDYKKAIVRAYNSSVHEGLASGLGLGSLFLVIFGSYALAIWFGSKMIIEKGYSGGAVLNVIFAVLTGSMSLGQVSPCLSAFAAGQAAAYKMFETINRKPEIDATDLGGKVLDDIRGDIELKDVYFSYPARPDEQIFSGFSLSISSGATVALVGQSGSGKSTVISLIERFYDPQAGQVLIDNVDLKDFQLKWIRSKIGLVSQEPVLFASTIRENIAYGKDGATSEEIKAAAELANAAKFIDKLPQGLDTSVGEHGTQLSGGQKQRVAIARAILKDPRILLLDEATSALDAESERVVQEALDRIMVNRTTVVVAHRLSTVRNADQIAVVHQGKVVEIGTNSELLKDPEGAYSQLIRLQEMKRESEQEETPRSFDQRQASSSLRSISRRSSEKHGSSRRSIMSGLGLDVSIEPQETDEIQEVEAHKEVSVKRLASLNKPEIPALLFGAIFAMINGCIFPVFGILLSSAINSFFKSPHQLKKDSIFWAIMFATLGVVAMIAYPVQTYFFAIAGGKLIQRIRSLCFEKVLTMEIGWFDEPRNSSGAIGARLSSDAAAVRGLVGDALALLVQNLATAIAGLVIAFVANWILAFIVLALIPLIGLGGYVQLKFIKGFSADAKQKYEDASQVANDAVGSIRTVASFCAEDKVVKLYESKCEGPMKAGIRLGFVSGIGFGVSNALLFLAYAISFYAGAQLVGHGKATFFEVFRVFFALAMAAIGISQSSSITPDSSKAKGAAASIFSILDRKSNIDASDESGTTLDEVKGEIELKHVSLITLDGVEIQSFKLKWLRQQMGLVSQEPVLFNDTIRANISYGKGGNATESESPKILLLDEATSALDAESERVVQDALDRIMVGRTTIVVAHRLSTIKNADVIAVVKNGVIVEKGKHDTLLRIKDGAYSSLVALHMSAS